MKKLILNNFQKLMSMMLTVILFLSTISFEVFAEDPKVSIIIPVYNTPENLLRDCLNSAKNQTLKDIEIICVDDGSTDGSGKILDEYAKVDQRFKVFHQKNGGTCVARDNGMGLAKGEYIQFLDHDDTIDPTMSEKCYNAAKEYDADIVKCDFTDANPGVGWINAKDFLGIMPRFKFLGGRNYIFVWNGVYKKSYLDRYNIRFKGMTAYSEDDMFNFMLVMQEHKLVWIGQSLYKHNQPESSYAHIVCKQNKQRNCTYHNLLCLYKYINNQYSGCFEHINFFVDILLNYYGMSLADIKSIDPELLQDGVINQLPIAEKIKLKCMMRYAAQQAKPQKTVDDGIYTISSKLDPDKCLDVTNSSKNDKANLQLWQRNGTNAQKFKVQYNSDGYYTIKAMCSGKFIDVSASGKQNGTNIWQYSGNGTDAQKWFIVPDGEGYYCLVSKCNNMCMDVYGAKAINGANIHCWPIHAEDNQRFKLEKFEDKPSANKPNRARKPRPNKPVKIKKNAGTLSSNKPGDSKKSA